MHGCGGQSQSLPDQYDAASLDCLTTLKTYCCGTPRPGRPASAASPSASKCSSWPAGSTLGIYATPCQGLTAVRISNVGYYTFYLYDSTGALYVVGDNAASEDPRSDAIECGAGPSGFVISASCAATWFGTAGAQSCAPGTATPTSVCN